jgi:UDP-sugar pyrophosphorylase
MGVTVLADAPPSIPEMVAPNLPNLSESQRNLVKLLLQEGQEHLLGHWQPGKDDDQKIRFLDQVEKLNDNYPGGLAAYILNARKLLADSKAGRNPFDGYSPSVPTGEQLSYGSEAFMKFEEEGVKEASKAIFVLVAGGLGERLGYSGIKIALPSETTTGTCYLDLYIQYILALQKAS